MKSTIISSSRVLAIALVASALSFSSSTSSAASRKRPKAAAAMSQSDAGPSVATPPPVVVSPESARAVSEIGKRLAERLQAKVKAAGFKTSDLGLWVGASSDAGFETYFSLNGEKSYIPASLSKLVTLGAVLHELKPGFKFKTHLLAETTVKNGTLAGPLYLKGGGDPSFVSENMWFLVNELTRTGVTQIEGDIVVDDSRFDQIRFGEDRQSVRVDRAYDAPIGAMSMNWNSATVYVRPGEKVGEPLRVFADVMTPYLKVRNETRTVAAGRGKTISVERVSEKGFDGDVIVVSGAMAIDQAEAVFYKSISKPDLWAGHNLGQFLKQRGITVKGAVRVASAPKSAVVLATSESKPLQHIAGDMSKWSNNYVAEMLVKNLAAEAGEIPATMSSGMAKVQRYLESLGFKKGEYEFINAAGFTRENRFTPLQLGRFLEAVRGDFSTFPEYLVTLPIGGVDGTLRSRMKNSAAERWVRAKTGLLNGVVGLAGYAGRPNGGIVSFAFVYNGGGREDSARALFDSMAASLAEN